MKIAITGGTGFIGRPLVQALAVAGHQLLLLTPRPVAQLGPLPETIRTAFFNLYEPATPGLLEGQDAVIHLASEPVGKRWTAKHKERLLLSRRLGTSTIARAAAESRTVKTLINASGIGFYGSRGDEPLDESSARGNGFVALACDERERAAEAAAAGGVRTVNVRIGLVLHPEGAVLKKLLGLSRFGLSGELGSGRQQMSWIHRDDLVRLVSFCVEDFRVRGPLNATAPNPVPNAELARALLTARGRRFGASLPAWVLRLAAGEMSSVLLGGQRVLPTRALALGFRHRFATIDQALGDLLQTRVTPKSLLTSPP